jgi:hypothetical protein
MRMAMRQRWLALIGLFGATWIGCSTGNGDGTASGPLGAGGGAGGIFGTGGFGGSPVDTGVGPVPAAWSCIYFTYGDGKCDCGCGAPDPDCTEPDLAHCEVCNAVGGCNVDACPGRIDPDDVTTCIVVPNDWTCAPAAYADGSSCDCGCGVQDKDCPDTDVASCDDCAGVGACSKGPCPSALAAADNTRCEIPSRWTCDATTYGDGTCSCGCGAVDIDCPDASAASCQVCDDSSCSPFGPCDVEPDDNAHCTKPPPIWACSPRLYHDGARCDCGCGAIDPDCESSSAEACDKCDAPGSCSAQACPAFIDAAFNGHCYQPDAPAEWTCPSNAYADGIACDCGCAVPDPDCRNDEIEFCARCFACGGHGVCGTTLDPSDVTQCAPPPSAWTCSAEAYRDSICDCGCGLLDSFCQDIELGYVCEKYPVEGCSGGHSAHIDPNHNPSCIIRIPTEWTCDRNYYDDGVCDCGCGVVDLDCASNDVRACEKCDAAGSCSSAVCPGTIVAKDTAHCSN